MVIGICGGSGSGKTSLVNKLVENFSKDEICILSMDDYYKSIEEQSLDENGVVNFDLPSAIRIDQILLDIEALKNGKEIELTEYTFNNPSLNPKKKVLKPAKILIIEGIFLLYYKELLDFVDLSVFIDVDRNIQLERRIIRDKNVRGYSEKDIQYQWDNHVLPCFEKFIEPNISKADVVIENNELDEFNVQPILHQIDLVIA